MRTNTEVKPAAAGALASDGFKTIMVHAEPGLRSTRRVEVAAHLADVFGARLIGIGAEAFEPPPDPTPYSGFAIGEYTMMAKEQIDNDLRSAEENFRRDAAMAEVEWRQAHDYPARVLAREARAADLIVAGPYRRVGADHVADPSDLVIQAGRPILLVPERAPHFVGAVAVVAWKETREARRAVIDALPLLRRAGDVIVYAVCEDGEMDDLTAQTDDVVEHLQRHGVIARAKVAERPTHDVAQDIQTVVARHGADLVVAGAYGHNRLQEWVFGGVTAALLRDAATYTFLSH